MPALGRRMDMTKRGAEAWRPPIFAPPALTAWQRVLAGVRRFLDLQGGMIWRDLAAVLPDCEGVVLDVGCGAQPYRNLLSPRASYLGIDTAEAKDHFGYEMPDTIYFSGETWPLADGSADVVLCTETLEHVPDTTRFLAEMARVVRPGGSIILTVPFSARYHYIPHDYWRFTPACLERLLAASHFTNIAVYARGNAVTVACYKVMALILPLLFPTTQSALTRWLLRGVGIGLCPVLVVLAAIANVSFYGPGGDDCLGYTVLARRCVDAGIAQ
jgi:SAM-dependent methyltransferase